MAFIFRTDMKCALNDFFDNVNFVRYIHLPKTLSSVRVIIYKWHFGYWRWNILMPYHLLSAVPEKGQVRLIWNSKYLEIISTYMDQCWLFQEFEALAHYNIISLQTPPPLHYHHHPQPISNISDFILINLEQQHVQIIYDT